MSNGATGVTGLYDFQFRTFDAPTAGIALGSTVSLTGIGVTNGLFTVTLDFGANVFTGPARYLDLAAKTNGSVAAFVPKTPRQLLTPAPYAIRAASAETVANGAIGTPLLTAGAVAQSNLSIAGTAAAGKVLGTSGSGLTRVDAPSVNPLDESIAFHNAFHGLMLAGRDGSGRHHVDNTARGDYWPTWTADGTWIVFPGTDGVYKIHPDGTGRTNLWSLIPGATQPMVDNSPMYGPARASSDGRWVVAAFNLNGTNGIYSIAADGSGSVKAIRFVAPPAQIYNFIGGIAEITPPATPVLSITLLGPGKATVSRTPRTPAYVLQEATSLDTSAWVNSASGSAEPIEIPTLVAPKLFRLIRR